MEWFSTINAADIAKYTSTHTSNNYFTIKDGRDFKFCLNLIISQVIITSDNHFHVSERSNFNKILRATNVYTFWKKFRV